MPDLVPVERPSATGWLRGRARALVAAVVLAAGCAGGEPSRTHLAPWVGVGAALALVAAAAVVLRGASRRRRRAEAAAWDHAVRIAELTRAGFVGELEAWVDREVGTPVASLLANLGAARRLLASGDRADLPEGFAALDEARAEGERIALVIRRMPQVLGTDASRREPVDLDAIVREALRLVGEHAEAEGVTLSAELGGPLPPVQGDRAQLLQVALSLLLQAVENAATSRRRAVTVHTALRDSGVELTVGDSGAGISEVDRAQLFAPFSSMRSGGLGIGVAMARAIVEAHGGRLAAERPRTGALFRVELPLEQPQAAGATATTGR